MLNLTSRPEQVRVHTASYHCGTLRLIETAEKRAVTTSNKRRKLSKELEVKVDPIESCGDEGAMETVTEKLHKVRLDAIHPSKLEDLTSNRIRTVKQNTKALRPLHNQHVS